MDIIGLIKEILEKDKIVVIPGMGSLKLVYYPAEIYSFSKRILPPRYKLEFSAIYNENDKTLLNAIISKYKVTDKEANAELTLLLNKIKEITKKGEEFKIDNIGSFKLINDKFVFFEDSNSDLLAENIGLSNVSIPAYEASFNSSKITKQKKYRGGIQWFVWTGISIAFLILFFTIGGTYFNLNIDNTLNINNLKDKILLIFSKSNNPPMATNDTLQGKINAYELKRKALLYDESNLKSQKVDNKVISSAVGDNMKKPKQLVYYIIAGSFKTHNNAVKFKNELTNKGYNPIIISYNDTLFRVALGSYYDRKQAVQEYIMHSKEDTSLKIWFLSRYE